MTTFIVEWDDTGEVLAVHRWDSWLKSAITDRNWNSAMVKAVDELDAYVRARRGEYDNY